MKTAGKRLKTKKCAFSRNDVVELHAKGLQRFRKGWETFIREKPASGWQVPDHLRLAAFCSPHCHHFSCSWRHISTRMTALCLNNA